MLILSNWFNNIPILYKVRGGQPAGLKGLWCRLCSPSLTSPFLTYWYCNWFSGKLFLQDPVSTESYPHLIQTMLYFCNKNVQWSACLVKENWHHRNGCSTAKSEADTEAERNRKSLLFPPSNLNYIGIKRGQASNNFKHTNIKNLKIAFLLFCDPHSINHIRKTPNNQLRYALSWNQ